MPFFVVHDHHARRHHHDLRLERNGVLESWAVPKGMPTQPGARVLAVYTEPHALEYGRFEGIIPEGHYGAGRVKIFDSGEYALLEWKRDKIEFVPKGKKLKGRYALVRFKRAGENQWLLIKAKT